MTQICRVCNLPEKDRRECDRQLLQGKGLTVLSKLYGVSTASLSRHRDLHISAGLARGAALSLKHHTETLLQDMVDIMTTSKEILASAMEDNHRGLSLKAIKEIRSNIEVTGKILFAMGQAEGASLNPADIEEFHRWKADKDRTIDDLNLDKLSPAERSMVESVARQRLKEMDQGLYGKDLHDTQDAVIISEEVPDPVPKKRFKRRKKP